MHHALFALGLLAATADGQPSSPAPLAREPYSTRPSVMAGLSQWTLFGGGNIAAQVKFGRFVVEYSHGQSLHFERVPSVFLTPDEREAGVVVGMPWTTGGGFGIQITPNLHLMIEAKAHRYEVRGSLGDSLRYTSFTIGPGLFYDIYLWKGLFIQPNLRWWPTVASTFDESRTLRRPDGSVYQPARHDLVPFVNVNIGWTFSGID